MRKILVSIPLLLIVIYSSAQTYTPVTVSGFTHDVIAETYPNSLATTDTVLDGSNYVMYSQAFATSGGFAGGLPNNGLITDAGNVRQFQLMPYTGLNSLFVLRNATRALTLTTPASFQKLSVLAFATEGNSLINVSVQFTDGSSTTYLSNSTLGDWFNNTANVVISGFGRVTRLASATAVNGPTTNPRFYYTDIALNCADKKKLVQSVTFSNVTTAGTNAPFPNAVFLALSGQAYAQTVTTTITQPTCGNSNGSATITVSGNTGPYTYSWNTTPVQTGATATGLGGGSYIVTITDAAACTTTRTVNIAQQAPLVTVSSAATPPSICSGGSTQLTVTGTGGTLSTFNWTPGNLTGATVTVSPAANTTYTVTGTDAFGCPYTSQVSVQVNARPAAPGITAASACQGSPATLQVTSPLAGTTYNWFSAATGGTSLASGNSFTVNNVNATTTYYVEAVTSATGCTSAVRTPVTVTMLPLPQANAGPDKIIIAGDAIQLNGSGPQGTYLWTPAAGLNATNILNPVATPSQTTTYTLKITNAQGCSGTDDVLVTVVPYCVKPMEAFTPNGDGVNDRWLITNGNCLTSAKVEVFNRYGNKVYRSDDYKNNWDGTYKGEPVPDGTYYFVITYSLINGKQVYLKGNVTVLR